MEFIEAVKISKLYYRLKELAESVEDMIEPVKSLELENADLRNELCLKCGKYHEAHKGACDGCRWKGSRK